MASKHKENKWSLPTNVITIGYILLICLGYTEKSVFYEKFGIDIAQYLDFEEYLFIFLSIASGLIIAILLFSIYLSGVLGSLLVLINLKVKKTKDEEKVNNDNRFKNRWFFKKTTKIRRILAIILFIFLVALPFLKYFSTSWQNGIIEELSLPYIILWTVVTFILFLYQTIKVQNDSDRPRLFLLYASIMPLIIFKIWDSKIKKADSILSGKFQTNVSFIKEGRTIRTNDTLGFIGQTKNYIFFRNVKTKANLIYRKESIDLIEIVK
jgi:hypothetical protein